MVRARRLRDLMILSRKRHLPAVMALPISDWSMLLGARRKGAQRSTTNCEEPGGIKDCDNANGDGALAKGSNPQSELLRLFDALYGSEAAVVNGFFRTAACETQYRMSELR